MAMLKWFGLAVAALFLGGVIALVIWLWPALYVPPVRDFRLVGVERVAREEFRLCDLDDWDCLPGLPYHEYLRIRVASDRNLMDLAAAHELNVWKDVWSCDQKPDRYAAGQFIAPGPHVNEVSIPYPSDRDVAAFYATTGKAPGARLDYDVYVVPRWGLPSNAHEVGKEVAPPYDITDGRDLCLRIGGGNMLGGHFVGNTVRVRAADIRAAMAQR